MKGKTTARVFVTLYAVLALACLLLACNVYFTLLPRRSDLSATLRSHTDKWHAEVSPTAAGAAGGDPTCVACHYQHICMMNGGTCGRLSQACGARHVLSHCPTSVNISSSTAGEGYVTIVVDVDHIPHLLALRGASDMLDYLAPLLFRVALTSSGAAFRATQASYAQTSNEHAVPRIQVVLLMPRDHNAPSGPLRVPPHLALLIASARLHPRDASAGASRCIPDALLVMTWMAACTAQQAGSGLYSSWLARTGESDWKQRSSSANGHDMTLSLPLSAPLVLVQGDVVKLFKQPLPTLSTPLTFLDTLDGFMLTLAASVCDTLVSPAAADVLKSLRPTLFAMAPPVDAAMPSVTEIPALATAGLSMHVKCEMDHEEVRAEWMTPLMQVHALSSSNVRQRMYLMRHASIVIMALQDAAQAVTWALALPSMQPQASLLLIQFVDDDDTIGADGRALLIDVQQIAQMASLRVHVVQIHKSGATPAQQMFLEHVLARELVVAHTHAWRRHASSS